MDLTLAVIQFHAMTPRALATGVPLGVHEIRFDIAVKDARTGETMAFEADVSADMRASNGPDAILAEQEGRAQRLQIVTRVAEVVRRWRGG